MKLDWNFQKTFCQGYGYFLELHNVAWVQFGPSAIYGLSLLLFLAFLKVFSPGTPVFLHPQKPTLSNSNLTRLEELHESQPRLMTGSLS